MRCELLCHSLSDHVQQLYTGFALLNRAGSIQLSQRIVRHGQVQYSQQAGHLWDAGHAHLDVVVDGDLKLHFDMHDAQEIALAELDDCDVYFKRSFSSAYVGRLAQGQRRKVFPFGLNYFILPDQVDLFALRRGLMLERGLRGKLRALKRALFFGDFLASGPRVHELESPPVEQAEPKVLFLAAAYDPSDDPRRSPDKAEERRVLNESRAAYIRALRRGLGSRFLGGFAATEFAARSYGDVTIPDKTITAKRNYLKLMKQHPICIATTGLHGSIGWKLAEYVACSRAVLSEPLNYAVPGNFSVGVNYLEFRSPEECVERALALIEDGPLRAKLMRNNAAYYRSYVRPDAVVGNALATGAECRSRARERA